MSLCMDKALEWASAVWESDPQIWNSFRYFSQQIHGVFQYTAGQKMSVQLLQICQGQPTATNYVMQFCMLTT